MEKGRTKFTTNKNIIYWMIFILVIVAQILLQYHGLFKFNYLVPAGDDGINHYWMAKDLLEGKSIWTVFSGGGYPPLFHWLMATLSSIFKSDIIATMLYSVPVIPVLCGVSLYLLAREIFNKNIALIAMALYAFTARAPYQLLTDGGYPNLLAASFLMPIAILLALKFIKHKNIDRWFFLVLSLIFAGLTLLTHHISTFYLVAITIFSTPIVLYSLCRANKWSKKMVWVATAVCLIVAIALYYFAKETSLFASANTLFETMFKVNNVFPYLQPISKAEAGTILGLSATIGMISPVIALFGLLGFVMPIKTGKNPYAVWIIIVWSSMLLIGSRIPFLSNPDRLVRDATYPLTILAAATIVYLWRTLKPTYAKVGIIIAILSAVAFPLKYRLQNAIYFEPMVRFTAEDQSAIATMQKTHVEPSVLALTCDDWLAYKIPGSKVNLKHDGLLVPDSDLASFDFVYAEVDITSWQPQRCQPPDKELLLSHKNLEISGIFNKSYSQIILFKIRP